MNEEHDPNTRENVTKLLINSGKGDRAALDEMLPLVYSELKRLASYYLSQERAGHTLQTTALVHEAYMRLVDQKHVNWKNRAHFLGVAAEMMRRILVNHARDRAAAKRGGAAKRVSLSAVGESGEQPDIDLIALVNGIYSNVRELSLLRRSNNPKVKDGERVALTGYVRSLQETLVSPFTKKPCVSYSYEVSRTVRGGKSSSQQKEYSGNVQVPSTLRTNMMDVRLLGLMEGDMESFDESEEEDQQIVQNAYEYLSSRQFQPNMKSISEAWSSAKKLMTDNDGSILEEVKITDDPLDLSGRKLEEWCLEINQPYSIVGVWSSAQNGSISDPFGKGTITVLKGDATEATKTMRGKIGCLIVVAIVVIAILNAVAYGFLKN